MTLSRAIGKRLRLRRRLLEMTQDQLGDACNLHRTYIGDIERGARNISLKTFVRLAHALNMSAGALLHELEREDNERANSI